MKKFFSLVVMAMFALSSLATAASVLDGLKLSGEVTVNKVSVNNEATGSAATDDYRSESSVRTMINMDMQLADDMDARVVLTKNDQKFGDNNGNDQNLGNAQWATNVTNAYIKVQKLLDLIDLKVGRMFYGERNALSMYKGPSYDYNLGIVAVDGYLATAEIAGINVEYLDAKEIEVGNAQDRDTDLQGLVLSPVSKIADMVSGKFYAYKKVDNLAAGNHDSNTLLLYGIKASADVSGVNVKAEYAMNGGTDETGATDVDYKGNAMIVGASAKVASVGVRAEIANGSGQDTSSDNTLFTAESDLRYGEIWGNTTETAILGGVGIANLSVVNVGADYDVNDKVKASADYLILKRNELVAGTKKIGNEIDLKATYEHSENLSMELVVARLMTDKAFGTDDIDKVNLQMNFKF
ncbi:porin [bacterium]|nr:porin [bacterium]MBU4122116.1 porin [bacterium]